VVICTLVHTISCPNIIVHMQKKTINEEEKESGKSDHEAGNAKELNK
jgi:hypothetical protein